MAFYNQIDFFRSILFYNNKTNEGYSEKLIFDYREQVNQKFFVNRSKMQDSL